MRELTTTKKMNKEMYFVLFVTFCGRQEAGKNILRKEKSFKNSFILLLLVHTFDYNCIKTKMLFDEIIQSF